MPARSLAALLAAAMLSLIVMACWRAPVPGDPSRMDAALRRVIETSPDSVVGLLVRTLSPLTEAQRRQLDEDDIRVASVVGTIFTARARARAAVRLAELPFVVHVQLAATVPVSGPTGGPGSPSYR